MPTSKKLKSLEKVTKLYLSHTDSSINTRRVQQKRKCSVVWVIFYGNSINRAFFSAGLAFAMSRNGVSVSLVEVASTLPNIGYYFSLKPEDYLMLTVDETYIYSGRWSEKLEYAFGRDYSALFKLRDRLFHSEAPHLLMLSFSVVGEFLSREDVFRMRRLCEHLVDDGQRHIGVPDLIVIVSNQDDISATQVIIGSMRELFDSSIFCHAVVNRGEVEDSTVVNSISIPYRNAMGDSMRIPPNDIRFQELAIGFLEIIGSKRKKERDEGSRVKEG